MTIAAPVVLEHRRQGEFFRSWLVRYHLERLAVLSLASGSQGVIHAPGPINWLDLESGESRYLAVASGDGTVLVFDTLSSGGGLSSPISREPVLTLGRPDGHRFSVSSASWYPVDSALLLTAGLDGLVKTWDANAGAVAESFDMKSRVWSLSLSPLHCLAAVGCEDGSVRLYDMNSGTTLHQLGQGQGGAAVWALSWSPTFEYHLLSGACDGTARLWDVRRWGASLAVLDMERTMALADEEHQRTSSSGNNSNWRAGEERLLHSEPIGDQIDGLPAGDTDSNTVISSKGTGRLSAAQRAARSATPDPAAAMAARGVRAHAGAITGLTATPDGLYWLSAGTDDAVRCWDAESLSNTLRHFPGAYNRARRPRRLAITAGGEAVFAPSGSAVLGWSVGTGGALCTLRGGHFETVNACLWNTVGQELYSAGDDRLVLAWTLEGGTEDDDAWSD